MKVLITGTPGSGKSTIVETIQELGYRGVDLDNFPQAVRLEIAATGEPTEWPDGPVDWNHYAWNMQEQGLKEVLDSDKDVFVAASANNQQKFYALFDRVFALSVDDATLEHQLKERDVHEFGQTDADIAHHVSLNQIGIKQYGQDGAIVIDNMRPREVVAKQILSICFES